MTRPTITCEELVFWNHICIVVVVLWLMGELIMIRASPLESKR
jgi:hypothetical protein